MLFAAVSQSGCAPAPTPTTSASKSKTPDVRVAVAGWATPEGAETAIVPGIDYASIIYFVWDGDVALAIWTDGTEQPTAIYKNPPVLSGRISEVSFNCQTEDGKIGSLTVGDQNVNLGDGWLVLLASKTGDVRMTQLAPLSRAAPSATQTNEYFSKLRNDPTIDQFFRNQVASPSQE
jgi:hypothetical protein